MPINRAASHTFTTRGGPLISRTVRDRLKGLIVLAVVILAIHPQAETQIRLHSIEEKSPYEPESDRYRLSLKSASSGADNNIDAKYYKLDLNISTTPNYLRGRVTIHARSLVGNLAAVTLDLANTLTVDSVLARGTRLRFVQHPTTLSIELNRSYGYGEMVVLDVFYHGVPASTGFGSFEFGSHVSNTPWVWTLSEPYGARDWWPCKDHPSDKADSVDIWITCNNAFKAASNGKLTAIIDNANGTHTYQWAERYPIATYLIFVSLTDYAEFTDWWRYSPTDSMPILNYVLPEHLTDARDSLRKVLEMLTIFSERFGLYPFVDEKYGHAEFGRGGAMEHQTMTSLTRAAYAEYVLAHELGHQWFGDLITCSTWQHLWINEGFASYCESIYAEGKYGIEEYHSTMNATMNWAKTGTRPAFKEDTTNIRQLFDQPTVYRRGASTLHMLRHVLGDSTFFRAMRAFVADQRFRFGTASTEDFQSVCETVSGRQLDWFFRQWIYGERYPRYSFSWTSEQSTSGFTITIRLAQTTRTDNPPFFSMPIDFRVSSVGWDTTVVLFNDRNPQEFVFTVSHQPSSIELDPGNWILKLIEDEIPAAYVLKQNYPNPFNSSTTIEYEIPHAGSVRLKVFNILGQEILSLINEKRDLGLHSVRFDAAGISSGVYFYELRANDYVGVRKLIILK